MPSWSTSSGSTPICSMPCAGPARACRPRGATTASHQVLLRIIVHMQQTVIQRTEQPLPAEDRTHRRQANGLHARAKELLAREANPAQKKVLDANVAAQEVTLKAADLYRRLSHRAARHAGGGARPHAASAGGLREHLRDGEALGRSLRDAQPLGRRVRHRARRHRAAARTLPERRDPRGDREAHDQAAGAGGLTRW